MEITHTVYVLSWYLLYVVHTIQGRTRRAIVRVLQYEYYDDWSVLQYEYHDETNLKLSLSLNDIYESDEELLVV